MNIRIPKSVRAGVGLIVVVALALVLRGWWGEYREAARQARGERTSAETSSTTDATGTAKAASASATSARKGGRVFTPATITSGTKVVIVLVDGLNLRRTPEPDGASIRGLKKGETLIVVSEKTAGWYRARDEKGVLGWVSSNEAYTAVKKR